MTHEVSESFDYGNPQNELQTAAVDSRVDVLAFMALRSQTARSRAVNRDGQRLEGYEPISSQDPDDEH